MQDDYFACFILWLGYHCFWYSWHKSEIWWPMHSVGCIGKFYLWISPKDFTYHFQSIGVFTYYNSPFLFSSHITTVAATTTTTLRFLLIMALWKIFILFLMIKLTATLKINSIWTPDVIENGTQVLSWKKLPLIIAFMSQFL